MRQGSTPTFVFTVDGVTFDGTEKIELTISQGNVPVIIKTTPDVEINGSKAYVYLSQNDTLRLDRGKCEVQIKVKESDGYVWASNKKLISVGSVLNRRLM